MTTIYLDDCSGAHSYNLFELVILNTIWCFRRNISPKSTLDEFGHAELGPGAVSLGSGISAAVAILMIKLSQEKNKRPHTVSESTGYVLKFLLHKISLQV